MSKKWNYQSLKMKANHKWTARPGCQIFVADRGAVRMDVPQGWVMKIDEVSVKFHDQEPPDDDIRLEVSFMRLPPADWSNFPLADALRDVAENDSRPMEVCGEITTVKRPDVRLVWLESNFIDPVENRPARSRIMLAMGNNIQSTVTMDYWIEDADRAVAAWNNVVHSLRLGIYIADPTTGAAVDPQLN